MVVHSRTAVLLSLAISILVAPPVSGEPLEERDWSRDDSTEATQWATDMLARLESSEEKTGSSEPTGSTDL